MAHLAVLIANPRQDISAADLAAGLAVAGWLPARLSQFWIGVRSPSTAASSCG